MTPAASAPPRGIGRPLPAPRWLIHLLYWHLPWRLGGRLPLVFVLACVWLPLARPAWPVMLALSVGAAWLGWGGLSPGINSVRAILGGEQSPLFLLGTVLAAGLSWGFDGHDLAACFRGTEGSSLEVASARALHGVWLVNLLVFGRLTRDVLRARALIRRAFEAHGLSLAGEPLAAPMAARLWPAVIAGWNALVLPRVKKTRGLVFARVDGIDLKCDVYEPDVVTGETPVVLLLHGGGWVLGSREIFFPEIVALRLAQRGCLVVNSEYRTAPETPFPGQVLDCKRAIAWIRGRAFPFGGNTARLVVGGESAGGNVALLASLTADDPTLRLPESPEADTRVVACVDLFGIHSVLDIDYVGPARLSAHWKFMEDWFLKVPYRPDDPSAMSVYEATSPTRRVRAGETMPPVLTFHGKKDPTIPLIDAERFHEALARSRREKHSAGGLPDIFVPLPGATHAFCMWPSVRAIAVADAVSCFVHHAARATR